MVHKERYLRVPSKQQLPSSKSKKVSSKNNKHKSLDEDDNLKAANEIRAIYGLPPLTQPQKVDVIRDIEGMMAGYSSGENPVDAVKEARISE